MIIDQTYSFRPSIGESLPGVSSKARNWMRLYAVFGNKLIEKMVRHSLDLPDHVEIQPGFRCLAGKLVFDGRCTLGDTFFVDYAPIHIGENVGFSFRNILITSTHEVGDFGRIIAKPIVIEDDVWITSNVTVLGGVRIGRGTIIGAGSVVTKDIPPFTFAAGNPCRPIKPLKNARNNNPHTTPESDEIP